MFCDPSAEERRGGEGEQAEDDEGKVEENIPGLSQKASEGGLYRREGHKKNAYFASHFHRHQGWFWTELEVSTFCLSHRIRSSFL